MEEQNHPPLARGWHLGKTLSLALACALALSLAFAGEIPSLAFPAQAHAQDAPANDGAANQQPSADSETSAQRVIKVGYMDSPGMLTRKNNGTYDGYTYQYLMHVAQFTGWKFEFVEAPGETDNEQATNLLNMLETGEVDLEGSMTYSSALASTYEYPQNSYGTAHTALMIPVTNASVTSTNFVARGKLTVALLKSAKMRRAELEDFCQKNSLELTTVECAGPEEMQQKVLSGEADAYLDIDVNDHAGFSILESFVGRPYFFVAPHGKRDVIDELDETIQRINECNPMLQAQLYDKYLAQDQVSYALNQEERAFAQQHETLRVGIISERAPVQVFNKTTGEFTGVTAGILDYLKQETGLTFEMVRIDRSDNLREALREANVDMVAGIDRAQEVATSLDLSLSAPYMTAARTLVYNRSVDPDNLKDKRLALPWQVADYVRPKADELIVYNSMEDCFKAVNDGRADYTYGSSYSTPYYTSVNNLSNLLTLPTSGETTEVCFGLLQPVEPELLAILNKTLRGISEEDLNTIIYDNSLVNQHEHLGMFVRDHLMEISLGCVTLLLLIIVLLALYLRSRTRIAQHVREENRRFQKLYSLANEQFFEYSIKDDTLKVSRSKNGAATSGEGKSVHFSDNESPYRIVHHASAVMREVLEPELFNAIVSPSAAAVDAQYAHKDGTKQWLRVISHFVTDDNGRPVSVIGKITDVNKEMREKLDLSERAHHDGLTGLLNWQTFQEQAGDLVSGGRAGALIIFDTDDFKLVNDSYGHQAGDEALRSVAAVLKESFRPSDLVGRLGGDEFAVCVNGHISHENLANRLEAIVSGGASFCDSEGKERSITLSCGCVELRSTSVPYREAHRRADQALYRAKDDGKNRLVIDRFLM